MKKIILACALIFGAYAFCGASKSEINISSQTTTESRPAEPTHWALCVTDPDNPREGLQERFLYAYDSDGVIWVYGTYDVTFDAPIRTAPSGRSDFKYKFMRAGVMWYLPA